MVQLRRKRRDKQSGVPADPSRDQPELTTSQPIPEEDALGRYLLDAGGPVDVPNLQLDSPTLTTLKEEGVQLIVPLVGQSELLGALYLGPRLSDQPYSTDDRKLLASLASQVAPAMKVTQLVQRQQTQAKERERIQQELKVAALIQQTLLPKELPSVDGWHVDAFYRPARAVGGDFYDFIPLDDGRMAVIIGDVTDKGVPAALVMATCRWMLRASAHRHDDPGAVLVEVNNTLVPEIPPAMFVTCLYAIIDLERGELTFANAGHNLPYVRTDDGVLELRATGMPLGLMPDMDYDVKSHHFDVGEVMVLTSDGITEAHNAEGEMYGFSRLMGRVGATASETLSATDLVADMERHVGENAEQEDDITLVVVRRTSSARDSAAAFAAEDGDRRILEEFSITSEQGNERIAMDRVRAAVADMGLSTSQLDRLETAVSEATMNAIEHGNQESADRDVRIEVHATSDAIHVMVTDEGGEMPMPETDVPDIEAKIAGEQSARGWGLFLIENMVDDLRMSSEDHREHGR